MWKCPVCKDSGLITLVLDHPIDINCDKVPDTIPSTHKQYPCPECRVTVHLNDFRIVTASVPMRIDFKNNYDYRNNLLIQLGQQIGAQARYELDAEEVFRPSDHRFGYAMLAARMYIGKIDVMKRELKK